MTPLSALAGPRIDHRGVHRSKCAVMSTAEGAQLNERSKEGASSPQCALQPVI